MPKVITQEKLDLMVNKLNKCITLELDKVCPILPSKIINRNNPWWTDQLNQMRKELYALYDKSKASPDNLELYKLKLKTYRRKCSKESQKEARRIQEMIENEQEMAKHVNAMTESSSPKLSTLTLNGRNTDPGKETGKALLEAHYPGIKTKQGTKYERNKSVYTNLLNDRYEWISVDRLSTVFRGFKAKKSPGPDSFGPQVLMQLPPNIMEHIIIIYKACIALHFTPTCWKNSTIIFIPKPGKPTYTDPKAYRPISLSIVLYCGERAPRHKCRRRDDAINCNVFSIPPSKPQRLYTSFALCLLLALFSTS